jgi:hypothetical protein
MGRNTRSILGCAPTPHIDRGAILFDFHEEPSPHVFRWCSTQAVLLHRAQSSATASKCFTFARSRGWGQGLQDGAAAFLISEKFYSVGTLTQCTVRSIPGSTASAITIDSPLVHLSSVAAFEPYWESIHTGAAKMKLCAHELEWEFSDVLGLHAKITRSSMAFMLSKASMQLPCKV